MITIMTINKRKGNNCNKRDLIDFFENETARTLRQ